MPLATTVIGSWPKPPYLTIPDWFSEKGNFSEEQQAGLSGIGGGYDPRSLARAVAGGGAELEAAVVRAVTEVVGEQADLGIGVVTDGEMERGAYYMQVMANIEGIDMVDLEEKVMRSGAYSTLVPVVRGPVAGRAELTCWREWTRASKLAPKGTQVKFTLPGPMTIVDGVKNVHYPEAGQLHRDLARCINREVLALVAHGCTHIQVDEPVLMRYPDVALEIGFPCLELVLANLPPGITTTLHLCCGYPDKLDTDEYLKADKTNYQRLAGRIDQLGFTQVSIEDAECRNDLSLLGLFKNTQVVLGAVTIARRRVETKEEIRVRVEEALKHIPRERLVLAPDCGLGMLPLEIIRAKLTNMVEVANEF